MRILFALAFSLLSTTSYGNVVTCKDVYTETFPGVIKLELEGREAIRILYSENGENFKEQTFTADPTNKYSRGRTDYVVSITNSKKLYEGELRLSISGELHFISEGEMHVLFCE